MNIMNYACSSIVRDLPSLLKVYSSRFDNFFCVVCVFALIRAFCFVNV